MNLDTAEFTINQSFDYILSEIFKQSPDIIAFSCYIWNIDLIEKLAKSIKKILPNALIIFGGPQASYNPNELLLSSICDIVCLGEGEITIPTIIKSAECGKNFSEIVGISYNLDGKVVSTGFRDFINLDSLGALYNDISEFKNKIIYFESSRGCPFSCAYCLSSAHVGVRFLSFDIVKEQLDFFLQQGVPQVKFVDRTFNCNKNHAMNIWRYIIENDNMRTNFHFEIAADLLDDEMLNLLKKARKGLFQFEIGVQSENEHTLEAICRKTDLTRVHTAVEKLLEFDNIHLHLDLIAGLPFENYSSFKASFNAIYSLAPHMLQLGFLKLLHGSALYAKKDEYGIISNEHAPFEVLSTNDISYHEIMKLKSVEHLVDMYYNSNRFLRSLKFLLSFYDAPFDFYEDFAVYFEKQGHKEVSHNKIGMYTILYNYFCDTHQNDIVAETFVLLLKSDMFSHEKVKSLPNWLSDTDEKTKKKIYSFLDNPSNIEEYIPEYSGLHIKQIYRQAHIEVFPFDIDNIDDKTETAILYNYKRCDLLGNAKQFKIPL